MTDIQIIEMAKKVIANKKNYDRYTVCGELIIFHNDTNHSFEIVNIKKGVDK